MFKNTEPAISFSSSTWMEVVLPRRLTESNFNPEHLCYRLWRVGSFYYFDAKVLPRQTHSYIQDEGIKFLPNVSTFTFIVVITTIVKKETSRCTKVS
jgi:hypothetical protein